MIIAWTVAPSANGTSGPSGPSGKAVNVMRRSEDGQWRILIDTPSLGDD